jgi:hypothetical protein
MPRLEIELPVERMSAGRLTFVNDGGGVIAGPFWVLGEADNRSAMAHGNPDRSPLLRYGDTPSGRFDISGFLRPETDPRMVHTYGPNGAIRLEPVGGDAALAAENGRIGLLIHGGDPGPNGGLRPTNGCLRLADSDMLSLMTAILVNGSPPNKCSAIDVTVSTPVISDETTDDVGDPPDALNEAVLPVPVLP